MGVFDDLVPAQSDGNGSFDDLVPPPQVESQDGGVSLKDVAEYALPAYNLIANPQKARDLLGGAVNTAANIGATLLTPVDALARAAGIQNELIGRDDRREASRAALEQMGVNPESDQFGYGQTAAAIAGTAGIGGALAKPVQMLAPNALRTIEALRAGGIAPNVPLLGKIAAGAATGGAAAGMINPEDSSTGAAIGAALPPVLGAAGKAAMMVAGMNSLDRARQALSTILGGDVQQAKNILSRAPSDITTAQALVPLRNVNVPVLEEALSTAGGKEGIANSADMARRAAAQEASRMAAMNQVAGGPTATAIARSQKGAAASAEAGLNPIRQELLRQANLGGAYVSAPLKQAQALRQEATRLGAGAATNPPPAGLIDDMLRQADDLEKQAGIVTGQGRSPLDVMPIMKRIQSIVNDPKTGTSVDVQRVLDDVMANVQKWEGAGPGGAIDADALYGIRKGYINEVIDRLLIGKDPAASKKLASKLAGELRPLIDNALDATGASVTTPTGMMRWSDFMKKSERIYQDLDARELAAEARRLYQQGDKTAFMNLIKGESPETVKKIMGSEFDISRAFASRPGDLSRMQKVAGEVGRDQWLQDVMNNPQNKRAVETARTAVRDILHRDAAHFPNLLNRYVVIANTAAKAGQMKLNANTYKLLNEAMRDPSKAYDLLNTLPLQQRNQLLKEVFDMGQMASKVAVPAAATAGQQ